MALWEVVCCVDGGCTELRVDVSSCPWDWVVVSGSVTAEVRRDGYVTVLLNDWVTGDVAALLTVWFTDRKVTLTIYS